MQLAVAVGYKELTGRRATWPQVIERFQLYSLGQVLNVLGRLSSIIHRFGTDPISAQASALGLLYGHDRARLRLLGERLTQYARRNPGAEVIPFNELQLISAAKVALLYLRVSDHRGAESLVSFGDALLMISDLVFETELPDPALPGAKDAWAKMLFANGLFHRSERPVHAFGRAYDLYLTDKPQLRAHKSYVDLPAAIHKATGMEPIELWSILFAFLAHWTRHHKDSPYGTPDPVNVMTYFTGDFGFTVEESAAFFALVSTTADHMKTVVKERYRRDAIMRYDVFPFAKWPLVSIGARAFCVSTELLVQKLTRGPHHVMLRADVFESSERARYLRYMGAVFEDYVDRQLILAYASAPAVRVITGQELEAAAGEQKSCDGIIVFGSVAVVLESKASLFVADLRTGEDWAAYERQREDIIFDAAHQIDSTISLVEEGHLAQLGLRAEAISAYYPLVVTLENLPMQGLLYDEIRDGLRDRGLLKQSKTRVLQTMAAAELEYLEQAAAQGKTVADLAAEKCGQGKESTGFLDYWYEERAAFLSGDHNSHLGDMYLNCSRRAEALFRSRSRDGDSRRDVNDA